MKKSGAFRKTVLAGLIGLLLLPITAAHAAPSKYLVILQAGRQSHEGMARAVHALLYSKELKARGHDVVLIFDGAGTEWVHEWTRPDSTDHLLAQYQALRKMGITEVICDYCATAFKVGEDIKKQGVATTAEFEGHPSIAKWADQGYQPMIL